MRTVILGIPHLASVPGAESLLRQNLPHLRRIAELSEVFLLSPEPARPGAWLGLPLSAPSLEPGPLAVAAFGADPPPRSVHFRLSLLSVDEAGLIGPPGPALSSADERAVCSELKRLNTARFTIVAGEVYEHALVWEEGSLDLGTVPAEEALGRTMAEVLPEGDGERALRRLVDDSVNLLHEHEVNLRRADEGLPPVNLAWPWGQGMRGAVPNLALRRGAIATVWSRSLDLRGLVRLVGYRHADPMALGNGFNFDFHVLAEEVGRGPISVVLLDAVERGLAAGRPDHVMRWLSDLDSQFVAPLVDASSEDPIRLLVLAPSLPDIPGLGLAYDSERKESRYVPFDERALDDTRLPRRSLWEAVDHACIAGSASPGASPPLPDLLS